MLGRVRTSFFPLFDDLGFSSHLSDGGCPSHRITVLFISLKNLTGYV